MTENGEQQKIIVTTTMSIKMGSRKVVLSREDAYAVYIALEAEFAKAKHIGEPAVTISASMTGETPPQGLTEKKKDKQTK